MRSSPRSAGPAEAFPPLGRRVLLKDEAYSSIKDFIFKAEGSDQPLSERTLAAHFGMGLGPVRSAVERLRVEGLVSVTPNSGIRLLEVTAREIIEFYEMRLIIECHIVSNLAGRLKQAQVARIEEIITEQEISVAQLDTDTYHRLDLDFHAVLVEFYGSREMARALGQLRDKMYRLSRRVHRSHPERLPVNAAQHRGLMEAVRDGDNAEARARMETHLEWGRSFSLDPDGALARR